MANTQSAVAGATRTCPHCRATILESAAVCPACRHHLRFEPGAAQRAEAAFSPLKVEGSIRHPDGGEAWEYSVLLTIRNARGEEIARQVVGVGALQPAEERTFTFSVDVTTPSGTRITDTG
ncbi:MAG TPA: hypothetical protein VHW65_11675 [Gemmatimonadales bacterium]|jgi:hypothetical protein|nr:hypothetical protein [Gemmatimonadales bacterium]